MSASAASLLPTGARNRSSIRSLGKYDNKLTNAQAMLGLLSNVGPLDQLIGGLRSDSVLFIAGSGLRLRAAESYCLRAQLPEAYGGFDGVSFFIDGGNAFDIYLFTSIARAHGLNQQEAMDKLVLSRAFTPYELRQLVCKDSESVFRKRDPRLFVVSDVFNLFEHDLEADESARIMDKIAASIRRTSERRGVPIVMTAASVPEHLERFVDYACNTRVELAEREHAVVARLLKHPTRAQAQVSVEARSRSYNQALLLRPQVSTVG